MIERIIENWLSKSSERSYQLPFCYMLIQEGYTIIHLTRHCGMEYGKDVLALDPNNTPCAFQLKDVKGSKYKLKDWQDNIFQIYQMVLTPLQHPSVPSHNRHRSFLVINGDIEEEAFTAISLQNSKWEKENQNYKIEVIVKGQLIEMALKIKEQFIPTELSDFKSLLEFQLNDGNGFLDKEKFCRLIESVMGKDKITVPEEKRIVSSAALLCSLALSNFSQTRNHFAIIEGWTIYQAHVLGFSEKRDRKMEAFKDELNLADEIITFSLLDLVDEINNHEYLLVGDLNQDAFVHRYRVTMLMGMLGLLGIKSKYDKSIIIDSNDLLRILQKFESEMGIWGEAAVPFILNIYWFYLLEKKFEDANRIIFWLLNLILAYGFEPTIMFTNFYYSAESHMLLSLEDKKETQQAIIHHRGSFVLETLLHLITKEELIESVKSFWNPISKFFFEEFQMENPKDFYLWRISNGKKVITHPAESKKWENLLQEAKTILDSNVPESIKNYFHFIPLFIMVYPHRLNRNLIMWYNNSFESI